MLPYPLTQHHRIDKAQMPAGYVVNAPVSGTIHPCSTSTDPMVSKRVLGEGLVIEITGSKIVAPFDGVVTQLSGSCHRIQIKATNGIKMLILFTGDTEQLLGLGFKRWVTEQQVVYQGQPLVTFNLQQIQRLHNPCYCAVLITNPEHLGDIYSSVKKVTAGEDVMLTITAKK